MFVAHLFFKGDDTNLAYFHAKKCFEKSKLMTFNVLNPISTGTGQNEPLYEYDVTAISRNRVKRKVNF